MELQKKEHALLANVTSGLSKYVFSSAWSPTVDVPAVWFADYNGARMGRVLSNSAGELTGPARYVAGNFTGFRPRGICVSSTGSHIGVQSDNGVGVLGSESCNFVDGCPCTTVVPTDALFAFADNCSWYCEAGRFWKVNQTSNDTVTGYRDGVGYGACIKCPAGQYSTFPRSDGCQNCPEGKYVDIEGAQACTDCPANTYGTTQGAMSVEVCEPCEGAAAGSSACENP
mmetsp:Transcript_376/g.679  ORF Transcript_376/g.679 Transcript_376/m.679 type:complete len:228 (+) Transcript_376:179-862(+)